MSDIEHEARVLAIDPARVADLILTKGGERTVPDRLMRRYVYDITPGDRTRWIRLRDTGSEVTLTVKEITDDGISGTRETEVTVSDFETANTLLGLLGYRPKSYQDNRRESFSRWGAPGNRPLAAHPAVPGDRSRHGRRGPPYRRPARLPRE